VSASAAAVAVALAKGAKLVDCSHTITPKTLTFAQVRRRLRLSRPAAVGSVDTLTVVMMMMRLIVRRFSTCCPARTARRQRGSRRAPRTTPAQVCLPSHAFARCLGDDKEAVSAADGAGFKKCIYCLPCDVGTHIDSPSHWFPGKRDIAQLTLEELTAPGSRSSPADVHVCAMRERTLTFAHARSRAHVLQGRD